MNDHVGDGEYDALKAGGKADADDIDKHILLDAELFQLQVERAGLGHETAQDQEGGDVLGDDGGNGHAGYIQMEDDDQYRVQYHIDHAGDGQKEHGPLGVAPGPEKGAAKVIEQHGGHTHEVDTQIEGGQVDDILRGGHKLQQGAAGKGTKNGEKHTADQA